MISAVLVAMLAMLAIEAIEAIEARRQASRLDYSDNKIE